MVGSLSCSPLGGLCFVLQSWAVVPGMSSCVVASQELMIRRLRMLGSLSAPDLLSLTPAVAGMDSVALEWIDTVVLLLDLVFYSDGPVMLGLPYKLVRMRTKSEVDAAAVANPNNAAVGPENSFGTLAALESHSALENRTVMAP